MSQERVRFVRWLGEAADNIRYISELDLQAFSSVTIRIWHTPIVSEKEWLPIKGDDDCRAGKMVTQIALTGGLIDGEALIAHAKSDARQDGKDWNRLSPRQRERYLARVEAGYAAAALVVLGKQTGGDNLH